MGSKAFRLQWRIPFGIYTRFPCSAPLFHREAPPSLTSTGGGSRTHMFLRTMDFESIVSAIPPLRRTNYPHFTTFPPIQQGGGNTEGHFFRKISPRVSLSAKLSVKKTLRVGFLTEWNFLKGGSACERSERSYASELQTEFPFSR